MTDLQSENLVKFMTLKNVPYGKHSYCIASYLHGVELSWMSSMLQYHELDRCIIRDITAHEWHQIIFAAFMCSHLMN